MQVKRPHSGISKNKNDVQYKWKEVDREVDEEVLDVEGASEDYALANECVE